MINDDKQSLIMIKNFLNQCYTNRTQLKIMIATAKNQYKKYQPLNTKMALATL